MRRWATRAAAGGNCLLTQVAYNGKQHEQELVSAMLTGYRERLQLISYLHLHSDLSFDIDQLDALWALFEDTTAEVPLPVLRPNRHIC